MQHHRLVMGKKAFLEQTLSGSVQVLADVLALCRPHVFGKANSMKRLAVSVAKEMPAKQLATRDGGDLRTTGQHYLKRRNHS